MPKVMAYNASIYLKNDNSFRNYVHSDLKFSISLISNALHDFLTFGRSNAVSLGIQQAADLC